jgi:hypothetical protein
VEVVERTLAGLVGGVYAKSLLDLLDLVSGSSVLDGDSGGPGSYSPNDSLGYVEVQGWLDVLQRNWVSRSDGFFQG